MIVSAYRLTKTRHAETAFDGQGARLYGGRWNSAGTRMVYVASSLSLATLELLVHVEDLSTIEGMYSVIPIQFEKGLMQRVEPDQIPSGWDSPEPLAETQIFGDRWVAAGRSSILEVPSAVTFSEKNYLLNPVHPDFPLIRIESHYPFNLDPRLT